MIGKNLGVRIKLTLEYKGNLPYLSPYDYKHNLQAVFYNFIQKADRLYADFLHEKGFKVGTKTFKYFTFSDIRIPKRQYKKTKKGLLVFSKIAELYFSTFIEETMVSLINGIFGEDIILEGKEKISYNIFTMEVLNPIKNLNPK